MKPIEKKYFDEIDSTNNYAKKIALNSENDILIIANKQTAGRGRLGRNFHSPMGGIYMSLVVHPNTTSFDTTEMTIMASVAVSRAIEQTLGVETYIKWVNDIFYKNKKVCGILTEGSYNAMSKSFDFAVIGVGINLVEPKNGFPDDIKNIAGGLTFEEEKGLKEKVIDSFLLNFFEIYEEKKEYMSEYKARSNVLGKKIEYIKNGEKYTAKAIDITEKGELTIEDESGIHNLYSGEIKICKESITK